MKVNRYEQIALIAALEKESAGLLESVFVTVADRYQPCGMFEI